MCISSNFIKLRRTRPQTALGAAEMRANRKLVARLPFGDHRVIGTDAGFSFGSRLQRSQALSVVVRGPISKPLVFQRLSGPCGSLFPRGRWDEAWSGRGHACLSRGKLGALTPADDKCSRASFFDSGRRATCRSKSTPGPSCVQQPPFFPL
jgi:hypothetical protein